MSISRSSRGEIHALLGENGAGKSTLLKILSGAQRPDAGTIELRRQTRAAHRDPHDAQRLGIVTIYQEFTLAPNMTIAENVFIGREPGHAAVRQLAAAWRRETRAITQRIGLDLQPDDAGPRPVGRRAADGRDRPGAVDAVAADRHGRADLGLVVDRGREALPHHPRPEGAGPVASSSSPIGSRRCSRSATATPCCATAGCVGSGAVADTDVDGIIRLMVGRAGRTRCSRAARPARRARWRSPSRV